MKLMWIVDAKMKSTGKFGQQVDLHPELVENMTWQE